MTFASVHVVVLDQQPERAAKVAAALQESGEAYGVAITTNRADVFGGLRGAPYDLVLAEVSMAAADDFAVLRDMPRIGLLQPPVIVYGAASVGQLLLDCLAHGAADYLMDPIAPGLIRARVRSVLDRQQLEEQVLAPMQGYEDMKKLADDLREHVLPLGISLAAVADRGELLRQIVDHALQLSRADGGILYLAQDGRRLVPIAGRITSLKRAFNGALLPDVLLEPVPLGDPGVEYSAGEELVAHVAWTGRTLNLAHLGRQGRYASAAVRHLELTLGYEVESCLALPIRNLRVEAVLLLFNARSQDDGRTMPFSHYDELVLESLASQSAVVLHNQALRKQQDAWRRYEQELEMGREIQAGFFPTAIPQPEGWELAAYFQSAREVAGDFYDVFELPGERLGIFVADVCDKGVVAALYMALVRSLLRAFAMQHYYLTERQPQLAPSRAVAAAQDMAAMLDTVRLTNRYIGLHHRDAHMFVTLFFGVLEVGSGRLLYVNAGHNPPVVFDATGVLHRLAPTGPAIGLMLDARYGLKEVALRPGDTLLAFTDGVIETRDTEWSQFGEQRLLALLRDAGTRPATLLERIRTALEQHNAGTELPDDVTLVALQRLKHSS